MAAIVFHAERLHQERVFTRVEKVCSWMSRHKMSATLFVYPFRAQVAGRNIERQLQRLAALGHEIGQHTHFYRDDKIDKPEKINDFSAMNIERCLHRDYEALRRMGYAPKGFTAGSWFVNETVWDTLIKLGFNYDCSTLFPNARRTVISTDMKWLKSPQFYTNERGKILCLPTTSSLGEWFKWQHQVKRENRVPYWIVYAHDYDLLSMKSHALLWLLLYTHKNKGIVPVVSLSKSFAENGNFNGSCQ